MVYQIINYFLHKLYEKYIKEDISFEDFYKKVKKNKTSQANYLEELINNKTITKKEFIENIYDMDSFLRELVLFSDLLDF